MSFPLTIHYTGLRVLHITVEQYYITLGRSLTASSQSLAQLCEHRVRQGVSVLDEEGDMIDVDDLVDWSGDLPSKFSDLRDEHFPLFTTYNGVRWFVCSKFWMSTKFTSAVFDVGG